MLIVNSGGGTKCTTVPPLQILGGHVPPPVVYAPGLDTSNVSSRDEPSGIWVLGFTEYILCNV